MKKLKRKLKEIPNDNREFTNITSQDGTVTITNSTGPTIDLSVQEVVAGVASLNGKVGALTIAINNPEADIDLTLTGVVTSINGEDGDITLNGENVNYDSKIGSPTIKEKIDTLLNSVEHDETLTGTGTNEDPLHVVQPTAKLNNIDLINKEDTSIGINGKQDQYDINLEVNIPDPVPTSITSTTLTVAGTDFDKTINLTDETIATLTKANKLIIDGEGTKYLADDGTYKLINTENIAVYDSTKNYDSGTIISRTNGLFLLNESKIAGDWFAWYSNNGTLRNVTCLVPSKLTLNQPTSAQIIPIARQLVSGQNIIGGIPSGEITLRFIDTILSQSTIIKGFFQNNYEEDKILEFLVTSFDTDSSLSIQDFNLTLYTSSDTSSIINFGIAFDTKNDNLICQELTIEYNTKEMSCAAIEPSEIVVVNWVSIKLSIIFSFIQNLKSLDPRTKISFENDTGTVQVDTNDIKEIEAYDPNIKYNQFSLISRVGGLFKIYEDKNIRDWFDWYTSKELLLNVECISLANLVINDIEQETIIPIARTLTGSQKVSGLPTGVWSFNFTSDKGNIILECLLQKNNLSSFLVTHFDAQDLTIADLGITFYSYTVSNEIDYAFSYNPTISNISLSQVSFSFTNNDSSCAAIEPSELSRTDWVAIETTFNFDDIQSIVSVDSRTIITNDQETGSVTVDTTGITFSSIDSDLRSVKVTTDTTVDTLGDYIGSLSTLVDKSYVDSKIVDAPVKSVNGMDGDVLLNGENINYDSKLGSSTLKDKLDTKLDAVTHDDTLEGSGTINSPLSSTLKIYSPWSDIISLNDANEGYCCKIGSIALKSCVQFELMSNITDTSYDRDDAGITNVEITTGLNVSYILSSIGTSIKTYYNLITNNVVEIWIDIPNDGHRYNFYKWRELKNKSYMPAFPLEYLPEDQLPVSAVQMVPVVATATNISTNDTRVKITGSGTLNVLLDTTGITSDVESVNGKTGEVIITGEDITYDSKLGSPTIKDKIDTKLEIVVTDNTLEGTGTEDKPLHAIQPTAYLNSKDLINKTNTTIGINGSYDINLELTELVTSVNGEQGDVYLDGSKIFTDSTEELSLNQSLSDKANLVKTVINLNEAVVSDDDWSSNHVIEHLTVAISDRSIKSNDLVLHFNGDTDGTKDCIKCVADTSDITKVGKFILQQRTGTSFDIIIWNIDGTGTGSGAFDPNYVMKLTSITGSKYAETFFDNFGYKKEWYDLIDAKNNLEIVNNIISILDTTGDGTKYLADNGKYQSIIIPPSGSTIEIYDETKSYAAGTFIQRAGALFKINTAKTAGSWYDYAMSANDIVVLSSPNIYKVDWIINNTLPFCFTINQSQLLIGQTYPQSLSTFVFNKDDLEILVSGFLKLDTEGEFATFELSVVNFDSDVDNIKPSDLGLSIEYHLDPNTLRAVYVLKWTKNDSLGFNLVSSRMEWINLASAKYAIDNKDTLNYPLEREDTLDFDFEFVSKLTSSDIRTTLSFDNDTGIVNIDTSNIKASDWKDYITINGANVNYSALLGTIDFKAGMEFEFLNNVIGGQYDRDDTGFANIKILTGNPISYQRVSIGNGMELYYRLVASNKVEIWNRVATGGHRYIGYRCREIESGCWTPVSQISPIAYDALPTDCVAMIDQSESVLSFEDTDLGWKVSKEGTIIFTHDDKTEGSYSPTMFVNAYDSDKSNVVAAITSQNKLTLNGIDTYDKTTIDNKDADTVSTSETYTDNAIANLDLGVNSIIIPVADDPSNPVVLKGGIAFMSTDNSVTFVGNKDLNTVDFSATGGSTEEYVDIDLSNLKVANPLFVESETLKVKINKGLEVTDAGLSVKYDGSTIDVNGANQIALAGNVVTGFKDTVVDDKIVGWTAANQTGSVVYTHTDAGGSGPGPIDVYVASINGKSGDVTLLVPDEDDVMHINTEPSTNNIYITADTYNSTWIDNSFKETSRHIDEVEDEIPSTLKITLIAEAAAATTVAGAIAAYSTTVDTALEGIETEIATLTEQVETLEGKVEEIETDVETLQGDMDDLQEVQVMTDAEQTQETLESYSKNSEENPLLTKSTIHTIKIKTSLDNTDYFWEYVSDSSSNPLLSESSGALKDLSNVTDEDWGKFIENHIEDPIVLDDSSHTKLRLKIDEGLAINQQGFLVVDLAADCGLSFNSDNALQINVDNDAGIIINNGNALAINIGTGLKFDPSDNYKLTVDVDGANLMKRDFSNYDNADKSHLAAGVYEVFDQTQGDGFYIKVNQANNLLEAGLLKTQNAGLAISQGSVYVNTDDKTVGVTNNTLAVKISTDDGNSLKFQKDGLFVDSTSGDFVKTDLSNLTIDPSLNVSEKTLAVKISTKEDNALSLEEDGLYVDFTGEADYVKTDGSNVTLKALSSTKEDDTYTWAPKVDETTITINKDENLAITEDYAWNFTESKVYVEIDKDNFEYLSMRDWLNDWSSKQPLCTEAFPIRVLLDIQSINVDTQYTSNKFINVTLEKLMNQDIAPDNTLITEQALIDYTQSLITDTYVKRDASNITTEGITVTQDPNDQSNYIWKAEGGWDLTPLHVWGNKSHDTDDFTDYTFKDFLDRQGEYTDPLCTYSYAEYVLAQSMTNTHAALRYVNNDWVWGDLQSINTDEDPATVEMSVVVTKAMIDYIDAKVFAINLTTGWDADPNINWGYRHLLNIGTDDPTINNTLVNVNALIEYTASNTVTSINTLHGDITLAKKINYPDVNPIEISVPKDQPEVHFDFDVTKVIDNHTIKQNADTKKIEAVSQLFSKAYQSLSDFVNNFGNDFASIAYIEITGTTAISAYYNSCQLANTGIVFNSTYRDVVLNGSSARIYIPSFVDRSTDAIKITGVGVDSPYASDQLVILGTTYEYSCTINNAQPAWTLIETYNGTGNVSNIQGLLVNAYGYAI